MKNAANVQIVVKNGNVYPLADILAPFKSTVVAAAHRRALVAYTRMCSRDPSQCVEGTHAD